MFSNVVSVSSISIPSSSSSSSSSRSSISQVSSYNIDSSISSSSSSSKISFPFRESTSLDSNICSVISSKAFLCCCCCICSSLVAAAAASSFSFHFFASLPNVDLTPFDTSISRNISRLGFFFVSVVPSSELVYNIILIGCTPAMLVAEKGRIPGKLSICQSIQSKYALQSAMVYTHSVFHSIFAPFLRCFIDSASSGISCPSTGNGPSPGLVA
mmetsp:Transcript_11259/g.20612  ORF Transcript_11259/g.20612 Transcript_11259/m.20612 type:complete len:214 (+) Transcript_11259:226-867(+)